LKKEDSKWLDEIEDWSRWPFKKNG
jgi:hypothetical protein